MGKNQLSIEQIFDAASNKSITFDENKFHSAIILIDKKNGIGAESTTALIGHEAEVAVNIALRMYSNPKFKRLVLQAYLTCMSAEKHNKDIQMLDDSLEKCKETLGEIIDTIGEFFGNKPNVKKKRSHKR